MNIDINIKGKKGKLTLDFELYQKEREYMKQKEKEYWEKYIPMFRERMGEDGKLEEYVNPEYFKQFKK